MELNSTISTDSVVIPLSRSKLVLVMIGAIAFVAVSAWMWVAASQQTDASSQLIQVLAVVGGLFFGACALYAVVKCFDRRPGLILDPQGIVDHSSALAVGLIPWHEILEVQVVRVMNQKFLSILVSDPEKYLNRGGLMGRLFNSLNSQSFGSPINISSNALRIDFQELLEIVTTYRDRYGTPPR